MRQAKYFRLTVLGGLALDSVDVEIATRTTVRPRHLAVLSVLALSRRAVRRDVVAAMFWGDETDDRARHSLSNALSALRAVLGPASITARREMIELAPDARLAVDAVEFAAAADSHDDARAAELYGGALLDGVYVQSAPEFDAWVARERGRLQRAFIAVCERRVPLLLRGGEWDACASLAGAWLNTDPRSAAAFTSLLRARSGPGTVAAVHNALTEYSQLSAWLWEDFELAPAPVVLDLVHELELRVRDEERRLAERTRSAAPAPPSSIVAATDGAAPANADYPVRRRSLARSSSLVGVVGLLAMCVAGVALRARRPHAAGPEGGRTVVAITGITNLRADTALSWLEDGIPQLITDDIAASGALEPVAPVRVRDVLARHGGAREAALSNAQSLDVARRVGAAWAVRGGLTGGRGEYLLDLDVRAVDDGAEIESFTVTAANPVELGQRAAARLLDIASRQPGGVGRPPRFAGGATDPRAYRHFVLGLRAVAERRFPIDARELDAAIAIDSGFIEALAARQALARARGDDALVARLDSMIARHPERLSAWDRLTGEVYHAMFDGAPARADALAAAVVSRFPNDPRAYEIRADVLMNSGRFAAADSVYQRELSLDSLAIDAGDGPCAPCSAYAGLVESRLWAGESAAAEAAARRWVELQPAVPGAWNALAISLEYSGRTDEAIDAERRMVSLSTDPDLIASLGRTLIAAHRFTAADSVIQALRRKGRDAATDVLDLRVTMARERGQFRSATELLDGPMGASGLELIQADNLARMGRLSEARAIDEASGHPASRVETAALTPPQARAYVWAHVLEGDALWRAGDTAAVRLLADSVRVVGARSYYGRDWRLYHHLSGLLALSRCDTATAERELSAARWGVAGWTNTVAMLGRIRLARGDPHGALAVLRDAYRGPLDAMGRYVTRTELDELMARAFARGGLRDSAAVYTARVRAANPREPGLRELQ